MAERGEDQILTVVVNGEPHEIRANTNQEIGVIVKQALREAKQTARPPEDWELRAGAEEGATVLDPNKKLRDYGIALPATLFLNLRTGGGGA
jgi:hypothetical protein